MDTTNSISTGDVFPKFNGFLKIWRTEKATGKTELIVDKPNLVLYQGADLLAYSLAGRPNAKISHMYVGYIDDASLSPTPSKVIDKQYSDPFSSYVFPYGYLRLPLTFPPTFLNDTNYEHNIPIFTVMITTATAQGGAPFTASGPTPSWIFEVAAVAALTPSLVTDDKLFSRVSFTPIKYDSSFNLTISWGVKFVAV